MDNFDIGNTNSQRPDGPFVPDKPVPVKEETIAFDDDEDVTKISHSPLDLGGRPASQKTGRPTEKKVSSERITGVKTFFTKLHIGAIAFLDEQINNWLKDNPGVVIKRTNTVTGMLIGKKTEPNIIVTVWY